jgi:hypothetical protein
METQEWVPFALLSSYKIRLTAVNSVNVLGIHVKYPILLPDFNQIWDFSTDFLKSSQYQIS